tara:strand:- start:628 stop:843 length:216 start_codon:yes stop_codon:yes gene_type:complete
MKVVALSSLNVATYSQSTLPKVKKTVTEATKIDRRKLNKRKYHHSALQALPLKVEYFLISAELTAWPKFIV